MSENAQQHDDLRPGSMRRLVPDDLDLSARSERTADRIGRNNWMVVYQLEVGPQTDSLICRLRGEKSFKEYSSKIELALELWNDANLAGIKSNDPAALDSWVITKSNYVYTARNLTLAICRAYVGSRFMRGSVKTLETVQSWKMANQLFA